MLLWVSSVGLVNIFNLAIDNDYFDDPFEHSDYGFRYLVGVFAILMSAFKLMSDSLKHSKKRLEIWEQQQEILDQS